MTKYSGKFFSAEMRLSDFSCLSFFADSRENCIFAVGKFLLLGEQYKLLGEQHKLLSKQHKMLGEQQKKDFEPRKFARRLNIICMEYNQ